VGSFSGADADQLAAFGSQLSNSATTLGEIRSQVGSVLERLLWPGADGEKFFNQWANRLSGMLGTAISGLESAAANLAKQADQQRSASGDDGGGSALSRVFEKVLSVGGGLGIAGLGVGALGATKYAKTVDAHLLAGHDDVGAAGKALGALAVAWDIKGLYTDERSGTATSSDLLNDKVNLGLDATEFAAAFVFTTPVGAGVLLGVGGATFLYENVLEGIDPNINKQIFDGTKDAVEDLYKVDADEVKVGVDAAKVVGSVASSGVRGAEKFLHSF
jgi:hypothetical protein